MCLLQPDRQAICLQTSAIVALDMQIVNLISVERAPPSTTSDINIAKFGTEHQTHQSTHLCEVSVEVQVGFEQRGLSSTEEQQGIQIKMVRMKFTPMRPSLTPRAERVDLQLRLRGGPHAEDSESINHMRWQKKYYESVEQKTRELNRKRKEREERLRLWRESQETKMIDNNQDSDNDTSDSDELSNERDQVDARVEEETASVRSNDAPDTRDVHMDSSDRQQAEERDDNGAESVTDGSFHSLNNDEQVTGNSLHVDGDHEDNAEQDDNSATDDCRESNESSQSEEKLEARFGSTQFYEDYFWNIKDYDVEETFRILEATKNIKTDDRYDAARQEFLRIYGLHKGVWSSTGDTTDAHVDVTRLHLNGGEYIAFMRIKPEGFRGERWVADYMEMHMHLLIGKASVVYRKRSRAMSRGGNIHVQPKSTLAIRCLSFDQAAIFVFKLTVDRERRREFLANQ